MKRQTVIFQKENILSLADMKSDIRQKMSDSAVSYILNIEKLCGTGYSWIGPEKDPLPTTIMTRIWHDSDYNDYITNFSDSKNQHLEKLKADDYIVIETIEDIT